MQNPVYQDQQENSKMEKIQKKPGFFKESALGFCPPRSKNKKIHQRHLLTLNENKKEKNLLSEIHSDSYMKDFGAMALS
jgi:Leucine-rich repeat (LRR) protein